MSVEANRTMPARLGLICPYRSIGEKLVAANGIGSTGAMPITAGQRSQPLSDADHSSDQPAERELTGDVRRRIVEVISAELSLAVVRARAQGVPAETIERSLEARAGRLRSLYPPTDPEPDGAANE
jgi:hypothetical protein